MWKKSSPETRKEKTGFREQNRYIHKVMIDSFSKKGFLGKSVTEKVAIVGGVMHQIKLTRDLTFEK